MKKGLGVVCGAVLLFLGVTVWPTPYRYCHIFPDRQSPTTESIARISRLTGESEVLTVGYGWVKLTELDPEAMVPRAVLARRKLEAEQAAAKEQKDREDAQAVALAQWKKGEPERQKQAAEQRKQAAEQRKQAEARGQEISAQGAELQEDELRDWANVSGLLVQARGAIDSSPTRAKSYIKLAKATSVTRYDILGHTDWDCAHELIEDADTYMFTGLTGDAKASVSSAISIASKYVTTLPRKHSRQRMRGFLKAHAKTALGEDLSVPPYPAGDVPYHTADAAPALPFTAEQYTGQSTP